MSLAGLVNAAMLVVAAALFTGAGLAGVEIGAPRVLSIFFFTVL